MKETIYGLRPIDLRTRTAIAPRPQPGYYPDFSTLAQRNFWDAKTRATVLERMNNVPPIRFFSPTEAGLMTVICAHIIPQDDRDDAHRIPILPRIDQRLYEGRHGGYRFAGMPPDGDAFHLGLQAIDEIAHHLHGHKFVDLAPPVRDRILKSLRDRKPAAGHAIWQRVPVHRFWTMLVEDCVEAYYAHPWAWDEIGFGGPAYPRGYIRLENGSPEPWESDEKRYEWKAPANSVSDLAEPIPSPIQHPAPHQ
jgi:gluconate 2-dehydrogenase subunit 3-like protein